MDPETCPTGGPIGQQNLGRQGDQRSEPGRGAEGRAPLDREVGGAAEGARSLKQEVGRQVRNVGENLKESVGSYVDRGKGQVAEQVGSAARALHNAAGDLEESSPQIARLAHNAAEQVERATDYLRQEPRQILRDLENFARREPLLFLGGALITGVLIGRFIKASNARGSRAGSRSLQGPAGHAREFDTGYESDEGPNRPAWEPRQQNMMPSEGPASFPEPPGNPPSMGGMGGGI